MDRGLLVALLALQNQFILPSQFLVGFQTWLLNRTHTFDQILVSHTFITETQRESLSSTLVAILEHSHNEWQKAVPANLTSGTVYQDMLALAKNDSVVLDWVKQIGISNATVPLPTEAIGKLGSEKDLYATIDFDNDLEPYATLTAGDEDQPKQ